ncbi:uncharacterized protein LOC117588151 isoform X5 [Drosophila guanche]|uniref:uncharacterized protein LOC117588151 isoform X5 n=1 Tax=Drosophila guanche TaxID=7266 RepID=UPI0014720109|nr:uncharacterized protein LOC117588151 isoform X5 [Drosophila guanche]
MSDQLHYFELGILLVIFVLIVYLPLRKYVARKCSQPRPAPVSTPMSRFSASYPSSSLSWTDRQGNALNASEERPHNRYGDIFFIEPSSEESARIRSQLEKDDKELPSYDEVMRMCNLTTPTAAAAASHSPSAVPSPIGIAALPAPPYSESDPHADAAAMAVSVAATPLTVITMEPEPSTSHAAQSPTTTTTTLVRGAPLTLPNMASNTEV